MRYRIPVYQPSLAGNEKQYVGECLDSTWISSKGEFIVKFEEEFSRRTGVKYSTSVCNGTVALHLALVTLGLGPGDEVIAPTLTYVASVNSIAYTGATPVLVDSLHSTWQMDPEDVRRKITRNTRAIMAVHLYGHPCEMVELVSIARENNLFLVEDCAEAFGSFYRGEHVGCFGDIATYSFYGNKSITTGEGGMVVSNDETLFDRATHFKGQGLAKHREYYHDVVGFNYRMTNICAAIGLAQLERADEILSKKREIAEWYKELLQGLPVVVHGENSGVRHSYWMVSILFETAEKREKAREALGAAGIETRPVFCPVHMMPMYDKRFQRHPVAESLGWRGINLPSWPGLTRDAVSEIAEVIRRNL